MDTEAKYKSILIFFVNGKKIIEQNADPTMTLLTYLREKLRLLGAKSSCGEGGCGACTVMASKFDTKSGAIKHYTLNACITFIGSMHGLAVTTVEGIGSTETLLHPVQERLAKAHGSQCGFCTPGFVMSMYTLLRNTPSPTMEEIEENLVGNLCRCTGYRPILEGFRTFSKDSEMIGCGKSDCCQLKKNSTYKNIGEAKDSNLEHTEILYDPKMFVPYDPSQDIIFPPELQLNPQIHSQNLKLKGPETTFLRVTSLQELLTLKEAYPEAVLGVGKTKIGVEMNIGNRHFPIIICASEIPELLQINVTESCISVGSAIPFSEIENEFKKLMNDIPKFKTKIIQSSLEMLKWFACRQIRNVASLGGNIMNGSPKSDFIPILMSAGATLVFKSLENEREIKLDNKFYDESWKNIKSNEVLISVKIPFTSENEFFKAYKQSRRKGMDSAIVNGAMKLALDFQDLKIRSISLSYGGIALTPVMALRTMEALKGRVWNDQLLEEATSMLIDELKADPSLSGGMVAYKSALTASLFFKFYLSVRQELHHMFPKIVPPLKEEEKESVNPGDSSRTCSTQFFQRVPDGQEKIDPVGRPIPHVSSLKQTSGEAIFTNDIPHFENELSAALVFSTRAHAKILNINESEAAKIEGFEGFFSAKDLPDDRNKTGFIVDDEEVFASNRVCYVGQIIGIVVAATQTAARNGAKLIEVQYEDLPNPIFEIEEAIAANAVWPPLEIEDGNVDESFKNSSHILEGEVYIGGQEHFYLETNVNIAIPHEGDIEVISSMQSPSMMQYAIAKALGLRDNHVLCKTKRLGGAFGGKETKSILLAIPTAIAAMKIKRPVRLVLNCNEDMQNTGGRNPVLAKWKVGFENDGKLNVLEANYYLNAGYSIDLSREVSLMMLFNANYAYKIGNVRLRAQCCKTNKPSNTAFRGFGNPQAVFVIENIISNIADSLQLDARKVRERNIIGTSSYTTHFQQEITNCRVMDCWDQIMASADYESRKLEVEDYNRKNKYKKRGISVIPLKYGISYIIEFLNQAGALVLVYKDGSVLISHGGTEMGQGLHTKMIQVASRALQIPMEDIHIAETATDKVPNTTSTAASINSDINGMAILDACTKLLTRLEPYKAKIPNGEWKDWVFAAYLDRVSLSATGFYKMPNIVEYNFEEKMPSSPFNYFSFGASVSEVEIDCLTGDHTVLRADVIMDVGKSLNPAIDIGQIEGAFMQGYGLLTIEQLLYSSGDIITKGPGEYKIPNVQNVPREFNVTLLRESSNERAIYSSKAIGEPPLLLAISVFIAIRDAVKAARCENNQLFRFDSPATSERIRMACEDWITRKIKA